MARSLPDRHPGPQGLGTSPGALSAHLEHQLALLHNMLKVTREQRRCLVEGDMTGLQDTNRILGCLLDRHADLQRQRPGQAGESHPSASDDAWAALQTDRQAGSARQRVARPPSAAASQALAAIPARSGGPRDLGLEELRSAGELRPEGELRLLARELQKESRTNYLLACRGIQFGNFSISLLSEAKLAPRVERAGAEEHSSSPSQEGAAPDRQASGYVPPGPPSRPAGSRDFALRDEPSAGRSHLVDHPA